MVKPVATNVGSTAVDILGFQPDPATAHLFNPAEWTTTDGRIFTNTRTGRTASSAGLLQLSRIAPQIAQQGFSGAGDLGGLLNFEDTGLGEQDLDALSPEEQGAALDQLLFTPATSSGGLSHDDITRLALGGIVGGAAYPFIANALGGVAAGGSGTAPTGGLLTPGGATTSAIGPGAIAGSTPLTPGGAITAGGALSAGGAVGSTPLTPGGAVTGGAAGGGGLIGNLPAGLRNNLPLITGGLGLLDSLSQPDMLTQTEDSQISTTERAEVPEEIRGPATDLAGQVGGLDAEVAPLSPLTLEAQRLTSGLLGGTGPRNTFADSGQQNEFIQSAFNRAANLTQPRLASEFSRAGRRVRRDDSPEALKTLRADELGSISSGLLLPLLESERGRQFGAIEANLGRQVGALPFASSLGLQERDVAQQRLDQPFNRFARQTGALGSLFPFFPPTQTRDTTASGAVNQPLFNNPLAGGLGGLLLGQQILRGF